MSYEKDRILSFERYLDAMVDANTETNNEYFKGYLAALAHVKSGFNDLVKGDEK